MKLNQIIWTLLFLFQSVVFGLIPIESVLSLRDENGMIEITDDNYLELSQGIGDYHTVIYITMRGSNVKGLSCGICNEFETILREVSTAVHSQYPNLNVIFFVADVSKNKQLIADLDLKFVPHLLVYPPPADDNFSWKSAQFYQYELNEKVSKNIMRFAEFLGRVLNVLISIKEPFDTNQFMIYFGICMFFFITLKKIILPRIQNKSKFFCGFFAFTVLLLSLTGYKFTKIKGIPFIARNSGGEVMFFSGGMHWQFGIEIFTMTIMYILLGGFTVLLIMTPKLNIDGYYKAVLSTVVACLLFFSFSYYVSIFMIKNPSYGFPF